MLELLISIVLLGTGVVGTLGALRSAVTGGVAHRDHSNAFAWLQSSTDVLYSVEKVPCNPALPAAGGNAVATAYEAVVDAVPNPEDWEDWQIRVVPPVKFWYATDVNLDKQAELQFGSVCQDSVGLSLQLIKLEVRSPDGKIIETIEIVK